MDTREKAMKALGNIKDELRGLKSGLEDHGLYCSHDEPDGDVSYLEDFINSASPLTARQRAADVMYDLYAIRLKDGSWMTEPERSEPRLFHKEKTARFTLYRRSGVSKFDNATVVRVAIVPVETPALAQAAPKETE